MSLISAQPICFRNNEVLIRVIEFKFPLILLLAIVTCFLSIPEGEAKIYLNHKQALQRAFPENGTVITEESVKITPALADRIRKKGRIKKRSFSSKTVYIGRIKNNIVGYAIIDNVKGKSRPITYMVVIGPEGKIKQVEILAYRESHGGEVRYPSFLKQFIGKQVSDRIRHRRDIKNISGATISCRAITNGARTMLILWEEIYGSKKVKKDKKSVKE